MFGLQAATGVFDPLADKEPLGLVVPHVVVALATAPAVGQPQLLPAVGRIDSAAELCGIDEGFDPQALDGRSGPASRR